MHNMHTRERERKKTTEFDASESLASAVFWAEDKLGASSEIVPWEVSVRASWCSFASNEWNKSTNKLGFIWSSAEDESSLNASVKHSLATSRPSRSTPGAGSTVLKVTNHHQNRYLKG